MRRYKFLRKEDIYEALNRLRDAFLAAKNGEEVEEIINGILTHDEKIKIGRRILVAECLKLEKSLDMYPASFELIGKRSNKVEKLYAQKKYRLIGGSTLVFKKREYTDFKRKDVKR